jgi:hypothetical protein
LTVSEGELEALRDAAVSIIAAPPAVARQLDVTTTQQQFLRVWLARVEGMKNFDL